MKVHVVGNAQRGSLDILEPLVGPIRTFRTLAGLPLSAHYGDGGDITLSQSRSSYLAYIAITGIAGLCFVAEYAVMFANGMDLQGIFDMVTDSGISTTDVYTIQYVYFLSIGLNLLMAVLGLKGLDKRLEDFASTMDARLGISTDDWNLLYRRMATRGKIMYFVVVVSSVFQAACMAGTMADVDMTFASKCAVCVLQFIAHCMVTCPPAVMFVHTAMAYALAAVHVALSKYKEEIKAAKRSDRIIQVGYRLQKTVGQMNESFSGILLLEHAASVICVITSAFSSVGLVAMALNRELVLGQLFLGLQALLSTGFSMVRRHNLTKGGDNLAKVYSGIRTELQDHIVREVPNLDQATRTHLDILVDRFTSESPISPLGCFNMNYSSAMSMDGVVLTYIIVLMQFRFSG